MQLWLQWCVCGGGVEKSNLPPTHFILNFKNKYEIKPSLYKQETSIGEPYQFSGW